MAIPLNTFEFEGSDQCNFPSNPWTILGQTPAEWFERSVEHFLYSPLHVVKEAIAYHPESPPWAAGVYFLLYDATILYVGQSNCILRRLWQHQERGIDFNRYWCFGGVPELYIERVEAFYIHAWEPPLNEKFPPLGHTIRSLVTAAKRGESVYRIE